MRVERAVNAFTIYTKRNAFTFYTRAAASVGMTECYRTGNWLYTSVTLWGWMITWQLELAWWHGGEFHTFWYRYLHWADHNTSKTSILKRWARKHKQRVLELKVSEPPDLCGYPKV